MTHTPHTSLRFGRTSSPAARLAAFVRAILAVLVVVVFTGCSGEQEHLESLYKTARAKGRGSVVSQLRSDWYAKEITLQAALDMAHEKVEKDNDLGAAIFAGEVLEVIAQVHTDIKDSDVNEFFYMRVGTLAGNAAAIAWNAQPRDVVLAHKLVLAGPSRWQTDNYWMANPEHDALASYILFEDGDGETALSRLRDRPDRTEATDKAYEEIEKEMRKRRR